MEFFFPFLFLPAPPPFPTSLTLPSSWLFVRMLFNRAPKRDSASYTLYDAVCNVLWTVVVVQGYVGERERGGAAAREAYTAMPVGG